ncbi:MAG: SagB/ThcOx family dehydrogenase [Verrucomicrobiota bacterium]|jgi:hypothetical protein|nr:SagB/ThcOx family dehydrogenase [Verrucomicrobiota bacterium]
MKHGFGSKCVGVIGSLLLVVGSVWAGEPPPERMALLQEDTFGPGMGLYDALRRRHASRDFDGEALSLEQLSRICWAARGINRPEEGMLTIPSGHNQQDLTLYVFLENGIWRYNAEDHTLIQLPETAGMDYRAQTGEQEFVGRAGANLVYVSDTTRYAHMTDVVDRWAGFHAGVAAQNVGLVCAAEGMKNVVRATFSSQGLERLLQLPVGSVAVMTQSIGP